MLLHGWTMTGAVFDDLAGRLSDHACIAPDLPGHGRARHVAPTADALAESIAQTLAPLRAPVVVGWSMGAAALWRYVACHGTGEIAGLITVDMSPRMRPAPDWPHGLADQDDGSIAAIARRFRRDWDGASHGIAASMFASDDAARRAEARSAILSQDPDTMRRAWDMLVDLDARAIVPRIDIPWLICSGAHSRVYPAAASDWIAAQAPQGRRHVFRRSGHSPHLEEPDAFAQAVRAFTRTL